MTDELLRLSANDLSELAAALRSGRLDPPYSAVSLQRVLTGKAASAVAPVMQELSDTGFGPEQVAMTLDMVARDRTSRARLVDDVELVTTGPEPSGVTNRDTSVVVRDLFANATKSVLIAGYAVYQGHLVFQALADRMQQCPEIKTRLFLDVQRGPGDSSTASELIGRFAERFRTQQWPQNRPFPAVYCDPRSLEIGGDKRACLHAKCVVIDRDSVFVSSANFTEAGQQRNIEVGLLIHNAILAERITFFFDSLLEQNFLVPVL
jgi:phosphatidylserine/phosphatidylglycerophosphate/cardiolipin synthase-like enzyme